MIRILSLLFFSSFYCLAEPCVPEWSVSVENENFQMKNGSAYIPIVVYTPSRSRLCSSDSVIVSVNNTPDIKLLSKKDHLEGFLSTSSGDVIGKKLRRGVAFDLSQGDSTRLVLRLPGVTISGAGIYRNQFTFVLNTDGFSSPIRKSVYFRVHQFVRLYIEDNNKNTIIDFGSLETGEYQDITLGIQSNTPVELTIDADKGKLTHSSLASQIPYYVSFRNRQVTFGESISLLQTNTLTLWEVLRFEVGNTERAYAGKYADTVTITAHAKP